MSIEEERSSSFDAMTRFYTRFLRLIAILPPDGRDYASPASLAFVVCGSVLVTVHWSMFLLYLINEAKAGIPSLDAICETVMVVGVYVRYFLLLPRRAEFQRVLQESRGIWMECDDGEHRLIAGFERKARLLLKGILASCIAVNVFYSLSAVGLNFQAASHNQSGYFLPYKWYADGAENSWPGYKFNFALQVIVVQYGSNFSATVDTAAPFLIMIGAGYFRVLQLRLRRTYDEAMKDDEHASRAYRQIAACSRLHQRILNYCARIDKITRTLFFVQLVTTGYNTSLIAVKLASKDPDKYKYLPVCVLSVSQLFVCQWAPDQLIDESFAVSTAAYRVSTAWMRRRAGKLLVLIIARAQRPVQMTAAGIVNLSLETFGSMLKGMFSFFTMVRNMNV